MFIGFNKTISLRLSESDFLFLQDQAEQQGMTVSQLLRRMIRDEQRKEAC